MPEVVGKPAREDHLQIGNFCNLGEVWHVLLSVYVEPDYMKSSRFRSQIL